MEQAPMEQTAVEQAPMEQAPMEQAPMEQRHSGAALQAMDDHGWAGRRAQGRTARGRRGWALPTHCRRRATLQIAILGIDE